MYVYVEKYHDMQEEAQWKRHERVHVYTVHIYTRIYMYQKTDIQHRRKLPNQEPSDATKIQK